MKKFRFTVSTEVPARILAEQLNWLHPDSTRPQRAPDLLVIIGSKHLSLESSKILSGPFSRLQLSSIIKVLQGTPALLKPTSVPTLRNVVGRVRLILVPEDWSATPELLGVEIADPLLRDGYERLSVFRHCFTYQMARSMLARPDREFQYIMEGLQNLLIDEDSYVMEFADRAGEFFFPIRGAPRTDQAGAAKLHVDAAQAIVGFLAPGDGARFDYRQGLAPARFHEAQRHLEQARRLRGAGGGSSALRARERLSRVAEVFGWSRVRWAALNSREDGPEILDAVEAFLNQRRGNYLFHPVELVWTAKLAFVLQERNYISAERSRSLRDFLFAEALRACDRHFDQMGEGVACRYIIATSRACMPMAEKGNVMGLRYAAGDIDTARALEGKAIELLDPQWFEFTGDAEDDPVVASELYRRGFWNENMSGAGGLKGETLVKYLGARRIAGLTPAEEVAARLRESLSPRIIHSILFNKDWTAGMYKPRVPETGLYKLRYVRERWQSGWEALRLIMNEGKGRHEPQ